MLPVKIISWLSQQVHFISCQLRVASTPPSRPSQLRSSTKMRGFLSHYPFSSCSSTSYPESSFTLTSGGKQVTVVKARIGSPKITDFRLNCACQADKHVAQSSRWCFTSAHFHIEFYAVVCYGIYRFV